MTNDPYLDWSFDSSISLEDKICTKCKTPVYLDETEHYWCCECTAVMTPELGYPDYWIDNPDFEPPVKYTRRQDNE